MIITNQSRAPYNLHPGSFVFFWQ